MNRYTFAAAVLGLALALPARADDSYAERARAFLDALTLDKVDPKVVETLTAQLTAHLEGRAADPESDFIGEALLVAYPEYRAAMKSWFRQYYEQAGNQLKAVAAGTDNDYLLAHANYFYARCLLQLGSFETARGILADVARKDELARFNRDYEVVFYLGLAQGQMLMRDDAHRTFTAFMKDYPAAPERYRMLATKIASELKVRGENELYDLSDRMTLVQNYLSKQISGKDCQKRETEIVELLDALIKKAEEQEQSGT